jgi:hypothetical protein
MKKSGSETESPGDDVVMLRLFVLSDGLFYQVQALAVRSPFAGSLTLTDPVLPEC